MLCQRIIAFGTAAALILSMTACSNSEGEGSSGSASSGNTIQQNVSVTAGTYSQEDLDSSWEENGTTKIIFNGSSASVSGSGASVIGTTVTVAAAGTYVLSGSLEDGQIIVDAGKEDLVRLVLNGVTISNSTSAAIYAKQAKKTILILADGTENQISDAVDYEYDSEEDEPDAAVFCKDDLTINGSGALTVWGNFNNGIGTRDDLIITGGTITVTAVNDGLRGRDSVSICDGDFVIESTGDGIKANNDEDGEKGWISLDGGTFAVTAGQDAIQAETSLLVTAGSYTILAGGGSESAETHVQQGFNGLDRGGGTGAAESAAAVTETETDSKKGLKAGTGISITGGIFQIGTADDAVHSNGSVAIQGGDLTLSAGDDGIHADGALTINDGTIQIANSYEGLEGSTVDITGGEITLMASDDGINAAGGSDEDALGGWQDSFRSDSSYYVRISGGNLQIDVSGDGIDSNGDLYFEGGTVLINGPTNNGNGALDYGGECRISGGILLAAGSSGMAQSPGDSSDQAVLAITYSTAQAAGTLVHLADGKGGTVISFAPAKEYQSLIISTPDLKQGETYTLYSGGTDSGEETGGLYAAGFYTAGTELASITLSDTVTHVTDSGEAVAGDINGGPDKGVAGGHPDRQHGGPGGQSGEGPQSLEGRPEEGGPLAQENAPAENEQRPDPPA